MKKTVQKDKDQIKYNKLAIIGLILCILQFFGMPFTGVIGIILSIIALFEIKKTHKKGKELAIAGLIILAIRFVVMSLIMAAY